VQRCGRRDRRGGGVLLVRHQRPDADDAGHFARRRRHGSSRSIEQKGIYETDPFVSIDRDGVGELVRIGVRARAERRGRDLKLGVCGEHGGDPASIFFFEDGGLDYVSASPFRVPVARLAAAHAALAKER